jgi:hypothetical protein
MTVYCVLLSQSAAQCTLRWPHIATTSSFGKDGSGYQIAIVEVKRKQYRGSYVGDKKPSTQNNETLQRIQKSVWCSSRQTFVVFWSPTILLDYLLNRGLNCYGLGRNLEDDSWMDGVMDGHSQTRALCVSHFLNSRLWQVCGVPDSKFRRKSSDYEIQNLQSMTSSPLSGIER